MSGQPTDNPTASEAALAATEALPTLTVAHSPAAINAALLKLAKKGKLAGYQRISDTPGNPIFSTDAFGSPFDGQLTATASAAIAGHSTLSFAVQLQPTMPWVFFITLVLSAWPGVLLAESMLAALLPSWRWLWTTVWYWYFPLSVISIPLGLIPAIKRSRTATKAHAHEVVATIRQALSDHPA